MRPKVFFDSNVLIYAFTQAAEKTEKARLLVAEGGIVSIHALNETASVLRRKFKTSWQHIHQIVDSILEDCPDPLPLKMETHRSALRICERYNYSVFDGLIIAAALEAHCSTLYSEDLQHGQLIEGLRIVNPFQ
jgi:predicted nucleic acid-binding protein